ncbi:hypothetical protein MRB53_040237 [Persea americana]|nr:hypothetical protein MRB53_040237 [Persea americana]
MEKLNMDASPLKKLDLTAPVATSDKGPLKAVPLVGLPEQAVMAANKKLEAAQAALRDSEPLLRENPNRFVLFPIKYHEVRDASPRVSPR